MPTDDGLRARVRNNRGRESARGLTNAMENANGQLAIQSISRGASSAASGSAATRIEARMASRPSERIASRKEAALHASVTVRKPVEHLRCRSADIMSGVIAYEGAEHNKLTVAAASTRRIVGVGSAS